MTTSTETRSPEAIWLAQFVPVKPETGEGPEHVPALAAVAKDAERRQAREALLREVTGGLDGKKDEIREQLLSVRIEMKPDGVIENLKALMGQKVTMAFLDPGSDAAKEWDKGHDSELLKNVPLEDMKKVNAAFNAIWPAYTKLLETKGPDGEPLYSVDDPGPIARDFWEPLVREGIIPENMVPRQFSEVERTFAAAAELYDARLTEEARKLSSPEKLLQRFDLPVAIVVGGLKVASAGMQLDMALAAKGLEIGKLPPNTSPEVFKQQQEIVAGVAACLAGTKKAADSLVKKKDFDSASTAFISGLASLLTPIVGKETAALVKSVGTAAAHSVSLGQAAAKEDIEGLLEQIGGAVADGLSAAGGDNETYKIVGEAVKAQFTVLATTAKQAANTEIAWAEVVKGLSKAATTAAGAVAGRIKEQALEEAEKGGGDSEAIEKRKKAIESHFGAVDNAIEKGGEGLGEIGALPLELKELSEKAEKAFDKKKEKELAEAARKAQDKALQDMLTGRDPDLERLIMTGLAEDERGGKGATEEERLRSMETLIAELKRQEQVFTLAQTIARGGVGAVTKFIPGFAVAGAAAEVVMAFGEAYQKGKQFMVWLTNTRDAERAVTVQLEAIMNRYQLQKEQAIVAGMKAALAAIDLVGKAMAHAGHLAPVGLAVSAGVSGGQALLEVSLKVVSEGKMKAAWEVYKKALANPDDRKAAREAIRTNPTLAKYALAWGAVKEGNRIAESALMSCGIDELTLKDPGTNTGNVVGYLELLFKDDPKLLHRDGGKGAWYPGEPELTLASWMAFYEAGIKKANPAVKAGGASGVTAAVNKLEEWLGELSRRRDAPRAERLDFATRARDAAKTLMTALAGYAPVNKTDGKTHADMDAYRKSLLAQAEELQRDLAERVRKIEQEG